MQSAHTTPVEGVILRRRSPRSDNFLTMKLQQSSDGHVKYTVLSPLSLQGIISLDDGRQWLTYHPDDREVMVQPSPRENWEDPHFRVKLAEHNYSVKFETPMQIAGRKAYTVLATSKYPEMPARRYCIDAKKDYLLRMEVLSRGDRKLILDTKSISFPSEVSEDTFVLQPLENPRLRPAPGPIPFRSSESKSLLGFQAVIPNTLPFGFVAQDPQIDGSRKKCRFLSVRITDGLASATVYEVDSKCADKEWRQKRNTDRDANGIRFRLVGEVPEAVWTQIISAFVKETVKQFAPMIVEMTIGDDSSETPRAPQALNFEQRLEGSPGEQESPEAEPLDLVISLIEIDE